MVTVVAGLSVRSPRTDDLAEMLKGLKKKLGAGGSIEKLEGGAKIEIELQGDHRDALVEYFKSLGYPAKAAGG